MAIIGRGGGVQGAVRGDVERLAFLQGLPPIRGQYWCVEPGHGDDGAEGEDFDHPLATVREAYDRCITGNGDGIAFKARADATGSHSETMKYPLTWAKWGIKLVGIGGRNGFFGRNRVTTTTITTTATLTIPAGGLSITRASGSFVTDGWVAGMTGICAGGHTETFTVSAVAALTLTVDSALTPAAGTITSITSYVAQMIDVTGSDNEFVNMHFNNAGTHALSLGGVKFSANRNYAEGCHFLGASDASGPGADTGSYSFALSSASECRLKECWFGTNSTNKAAANAEILLTGAQGQNFFDDCYVVTKSATAGHGAVNVVTAATLNGWTYFRNCTFTNWRASKGADLTAAFIFTATASNDEGIILHNCAMKGWAAWTGNYDAVYVACSDATASGAGGIATTV